MTQYSSVNVKLSNSQLNKLRSGIKNSTKITLIHSSNVNSSSKDKTNFPQVSRPRKAFANNLSANIKLSKTQHSKIVESGGFLGTILGLLLKTGLLLMKNVLKP